MEDTNQTQLSQHSQDAHSLSNHALPQEPIKKNFIDLKRIEIDKDDNHKQVIQDPNAAQGYPSIQILEEQQGNEKSQISTTELTAQQPVDEKIKQQNININFTNASSSSPRKGERNSLSPKRRMQQGGTNSPCMSPLPDLKVQRSKFDISQTQFFITNINAFRGLESFPKINELYSQISNVIEDLEGKVDTVVERHEAEFLFAYRNHMAKIKTEMVDMKKQAEEQEKRLNDNDRVAGLERQIVWLRDECLNLYKILGKKKDDLASRERNIRDLQRDNQHLQTQIKEMMRKNKLMQMKIPLQQTNMSNNNINNTQQSIIGLTDQLLNLQSTQQSPKSQHQASIIVDNNNNTSQQQPQQQQIQSGIQQLQNSIQEDDMYLTSNNQFQVYQNQVSPSNISSKRVSLQPQNQSQIVQQIGLISQGAFNPIPFDQVLTQKQIAALEEANPEFGGKIISIAKRNIEGEISVAALIHEIAQLCKYISDRKQKQYKQVKDKLEKTLKDKLKMGMARSDLESFFLECVETARKQIIKRKYAAGGVFNSTSSGGNGGVLNNATNLGNQNSALKSPLPSKNMSEFIESIKDYKIFRNEDKVKILELLLSHEKLLMFLYQKIFPTNFNMHLQNALDSQEDIPVYLRPFPQSQQQTGTKYINIQDSQQNSYSKNNDNYLDLLSEEDATPSQDNNIFYNKNIQLQEQPTKLPHISESYSQQQYNNLYSVKHRQNQKRNSLDQKNILEQSSQHNTSLIENSTSSATSKQYQVQASKLGVLSSKFSQQRNSSLKSSYRNGNGYEVSSLQQKKNSAQKQHVGNNSFEQNHTAAYNIHSDLYSQLTASDQKKNSILSKGSSSQVNTQKGKSQNQNGLSNTSPLSHANSSESTHLVADKLNVVNGKLVFKNI